MDKLVQLKVMGIDLTVEEIQEAIKDPKILDKYTEQGKVTSIFDNKTYGNLGTAQRKLADGICHFFYMKKGKDGAADELREAFGTLKPELIPRYKTADVEQLLTCSKYVGEDLQNVFEDLNMLQADPDPIKIRLDALGAAIKVFEPKEKKSTAKALNENVQSYFDLGAGDWRAFNKDKFVFCI